MSKKRVLFLSFTFLLLLSQGEAEARQSKEDTIFSIPFHLDSRLMVFEGEMNGSPAFFAFDTGAGLGLAGQGYVKNKRVKAKKKRITIRDSNDNTKRVQTGKTKKMKIGGFQISNVESLVTDMPYLECQDYFLLGSNVIKLLNWEIDFDNMMLRVSKKPFPTDPKFLSMKVEYKGNRPFTSLSFAGIDLSEVLIDTGYSRFLDIDTSSDSVSDYIEAKAERGLTNENISLSTGAISTALDETIQIRIDTLFIGEDPILDVPSDFIETKYPKIGIGFFQSLSHKTIINNTESTYYLHLRKQQDFTDPFLLNLQYDEGKVIVAGKSLEKDPVYEQVEIGDEVISINGYPTSDFSDECAFSSWYFTYNEGQMTIETSSGKSLKFTRTSLK